MLEPGGDRTTDYSGMIEIVKDIGELRSLRDQWNEVADIMENPLLRHEWVVTAARTLFSQNEIHFYIYRQGGRICAIAPLLKVGVGVRARLYLIGFPRLYEPSDFLYRDEASLAALMRAIARQDIPVCFHRIPQSSPIHGFRFWKFAYLVSQAKEKNPSYSQYLEIKADWKEFFASLTSKNRNDLSRALRKAEKIGVVCFDIVKMERRTQQHYFSEFLSLERRSWKARRGSAITSIAHLNNFFSTFVSLASDNGYLYYAGMKIDDRLIAAQIFSVKYGKLWTLKIAHDQEYGFCSPGAVLMNQVVRFAFEQRLKGIEFLGRAEPWLKKWTSGIRCYVDFVYFPLSFTSAVHVLKGLKSRVIGRSGRMRVIR